MRSTMFTLAASATMVAAVEYAAIGLKNANEWSEQLAIQVISPGSGIIRSGPNLTFAPPAMPCANGFIPSPTGGLFIVPANNTQLTFISATNGSIVRSVPLNPPYILNFLQYYPTDSKLYSMGSPVAPSAAASADTAPNLKLVSIDVTTGDVTTVFGLPVNNVLPPCASYSLDVTSGLLAYGFMVPWNRQFLSGVSITGDASKAFNVSLNNGTLQSVAPLPPAKDGSQAVLFVTVDAIGSMLALQAMDVATGNASVLVPIDLRYVNAYQGTLTYDPPSQTAALVSNYVADDGTVYDVLMTFDLSGMARSQEGIYSLPNAGFNVTTLGIAGSDSPIAPLGFWTIAKLN